ncbi:MAG: flavin reductase family protein [Candidatus Thermoplasmatota archaeon]
MFYTRAFPKLTVLVTCIDEDKPNIITVAWHSPISALPPLYGILLSPKRYSHELIHNSKEFTINFCGFDIIEKVHMCGKVSGRNTDKFKITGLTKVKAKKVKPPIIGEAYASFECKLVEEKKYGDHTLFVGEVVEVSEKEGIFKEEIMREGIYPIYYLGKDQYTTLDGRRARF